MRGPQAGHGASCGNGATYFGKKRSAMLFPLQAGLRRP